MVYRYYVPYVHNSGVPEARPKGNGRHGKQAVEVGRLESRKPDLKSKGRTLDTYATYMVNSYQGKVDGVIL